MEACRTQWLLRMGGEEMIELLPCPFCGSEAELWSESQMAIISCKKFCVHSKGYIRVDDAIDAWNTRAERTCRIEYPYYGDAPVINAQPRCSECHEHFAVGEFPNYCPSCGRKVLND